ncbi:MAG: hypothetical protein CEN88_441 [Candidatus Berkelbacteria bacterium Licking1014_2]|uniref:L,D-TPase catalytic domain-containing protein n=1 Tax=Candidatus Berkelbacteria bacterium Licking1014_2 TaxID=2017146 RepID=A0A554LSW2_9BACT|nr:MAG: hypothetical protein CEN88_441 [Candidatus Berkelbacteria bacterium Licking1014_2]
MNRLVQVSLAISLFLLVLIGGFFIYQLSFGHKIYLGITWAKTDLSGLTKTQAETKVSQKIKALDFSGAEINLGKTIIYPRLSDLGIKLDEKTISQQAQQIGRDQTFILNQYHIAKYLLKPHRLVVEPKIDSNKLHQYLQQNAGDLEKPAQNAELTAKNGQIAISEDKAGFIIDEDKLKQNLKEVSVAAVNRQVNPDGQVVQEGRVGRQLDAVKTSQQIEGAINDSMASRQIILEFKTVEPKETIANAMESAAVGGRYSSKYIEINLADQKLYTWDGSGLADAYTISSGRAGMGTPTGDFQILNKSARAWSDKYELYMPLWMAFLGSEYGIHELPEWPNGAKEGEGHLGTPVSHGCVRLGVGAAEAVYNWTDISTPVYIH